MRDEIKEYLNSEEGSLPWQQNYIKRTYRNNNTSGVQPEGEGGGWRRGAGPDPCPKELYALISKKQFFSFNVSVMSNTGVQFFCKYFNHPEVFSSRSI